MLDGTSTVDADHAVRRRRRRRRRSRTCSIVSEPKVDGRVDRPDPCTAIDTVLDIRARDALRPGSAHRLQRRRHRDQQASTLTVALQPGIYYIIVEGHDSTVDTGAYALQVKLRRARARRARCDERLRPRAGVPDPARRHDDGVLAAGLQRRRSTTTATARSTSRTIRVRRARPTPPRTTYCPDRSDCPACGNGLDDDGDGQIDFPTTRAASPRRRSARPASERAASSPRPR